MVLGKVLKCLNCCVFSQARARYCDAFAKFNKHYVVVLILLIM